ncbi:MAG: hypothetical protein RSB62_08965, partial [Bacteroides sp.]
YFFNRLNDHRSMLIVERMSVRPFSAILLFDGVDQTLADGNPHLPGNRKHNYATRKQKDEWQQPSVGYQCVNTIRRDEDTEGCQQ